MEMILKLLGYKPLKETKEKIIEVQKLNGETEDRIDELTATLNGEEGWFLCKRKHGGRRDGDGLGD